MAPSETPVLSFADLKLSYVHGGQSKVVLEGVNLDVRAGEFLAIVGPSGCGKSTILRLASGLATASSGRSLFRGKPIEGINQSVGFVTQDSKLFPWLTLIQNVAFPLKVRGVPPEERERKARALIQQVGLSGFEHAYPHQLSGGMQKRASIARTLIYRPEVILMDEPFGPLDAQTKLVMQQDLLDLWSGSNTTVIFVTHDLAEALFLADRIAVMTRGPGRIKRIFENPLPRPRDVLNLHQDPAFQAMYAEVWEYFKSEIGSYRGHDEGEAS